MSDVYDGLLDEEESRLRSDVRQKDTASPYDAALDDEAQQRQAQLGASLRRAVAIKPDAAAKQQVLSSASGLPVPVVERNEDIVALQQRVRELHDLSRTSPILAQQLTDPQFAALAHDDAEHLSLVEKTLRTYVGASTKSGLESLLGVGARLADTLNPFTLSEQDAAVLFKDNPAKLLEMRRDSPAMVLTRFSEAMQQASQESMKNLSPEAALDYGKLEYATLDTTKAAWLSPVKVVGDAIQSLPTSLAMAASVYLTRGAAARAEQQAIAAGATSGAAKVAAIKAAAETMAKLSAGSEGVIGYAQQANQTREQANSVDEKALESNPNYQKLTAEGFSPEAARVWLSAKAAHESGLMAGTADAIVAYFGGQYLGKIIGEGGKLAPRVLRGFGVEAGTEAVQSGLEQLSQNATVRENLDPSQDLTDQVLENIVQGFFVGGVTGGAFTGVLGGERKAGEAQRAQLFWRQLQQLAAASKLRERAPNSFGDFVQAAAADGPLTDVYVSGQQLAAVLQQSPNTPVPQSVKAQLSEALLTGGDVRIPIGEYTAHLAASDAGSALLEHLKTSPDAMSHAEAQTFYQEQAAQFKQEAEKILAGAANVQQAQQEADAVKQHFFDQLAQANRFTPEVNNAYASLMRDFYVTMAQRLGITPQEMLQRYPLRVAAENVAGQVVMDQAGKPLTLYHATNQDISAFNVKDGIAGWFSTKEFANDFAMVKYGYWKAKHLGWENQKMVPEGVNIMPVNVSLRNPFDFSGVVGSLAAKATPEDVAAVAKAVGVEPAAITLPERARVFDIVRDPAVVQAVKAAGHDGMVASETGAPVYVAFEPNQIKSVFNENPTDSPNILEQSALDRIKELTGFARIEKNLKPEERAKLRMDTAQRLLDLLSELPSAIEMAHVALAGQAKRGWYQHSAEAMVNVFGADAPRFAALLAAMSPQTSVEMNLSNALKTWANWNKAKRPQGRDAILAIMGASVEGSKLTKSVLPAWINNAVSALTTEDPGKLVLSGPKVNSFFNNLVGVSDEVTNDAWMANYAAVDQAIFAGGLNVAGTDPGKTPGYLAMAVRVRQAAEKLSQMTGETWTPAEVQETVWSWAKTVYELADNANESRSAVELLKDGAVTDSLINATPDFRTLFGDPKYQSILAKAGYGQQVKQLQDAQRADAIAGAQAAGAQGQAGPPVGSPPNRHLIAAARRLDTLRRERRQSAADAGSATRAETAARTVQERGGVPGIVGEVAGEPGQDSFERPVQGLPAKVEVPGRGAVRFGPFRTARIAAASYMERMGLRYAPASKYGAIDPKRGARIAQAFEEMKHAPNDPEVKAAYDAMINETVEQFREIQKTGLKVEFITGDDPYAKSPRYASLDAVENNHLWVFPTDAGFGGGSEAHVDVSGNPLLALTDIYVDGRQLRANDVFRIVHDYFGHIKEGFGFRAEGEDNAWQSHAAMYSPLARRAMTTETRGQNSWVNFGPYAKQNKGASAAATQYAPQKIGLLPEWASQEGMLAGAESGMGVFEQGMRKSDYLYNVVDKDGKVMAEKKSYEEAKFINLTRAHDEGKLEPVGPAPETLDQQARGQISFDPGLTTPTTITLLRNADLSTFLHESGHFFLEVMSDIASRPDAPAEITADMDSTLKWFGIKDLAAWRAMTISEKREFHEKFARGFEVYLFEGKSPNAETQSLFSRFRAWLINVYKSLTALDVELNSEVRGVFDRMLAADEQIKMAEDMRGMAPMFASQKEAKATTAEWEAYLKLGGNATEEAVRQLERRSLADLKWAQNARSRVITELQKEADAKRAAIRTDVETEVKHEPIYQALRFLQYGELLEGDRSNAQRKILEGAGMEGSKLSLPALKEMYGEAANALWRYFPTGKTGMVVAEGGLHPDLAAELFGFSSGDELVRKLLAAEPMRTVVDAMTDQRMLENHGDLVDQQSIERAADKAVHSEARARAIATELRFLDRVVHVSEKTPAGGSVNVLAKAARQFAEAIVARKKVKDIKPAQFAAAEARAAKAAQKAKSPLEKATEKRNQLVNNYATRAAHEAVAEVEKALRYLRRFEVDSTRKNLDHDYLDQIDSLLERYDLRQATQTEVQKRASLLEWVEKQRELGFEPTIDKGLLAEANRQHFSTLSVEEFRGLVDAVKNIEHLARLKKKLLTAKDQREFAAAVDEITASIEANAKGTVKERKASDRGPLVSIGQLFRNFMADHRKFASLAREMDGWTDAGPMWERFVRTMNDAGNFEAVEREKATMVLSKILAPIVKEGKLGRKTYIQAIDKSLTREERIGIALNMGNQTNVERVVTGEKWSLQQLNAVLDTLTKEEWDFVQKTWDYLESFRPQIAEKTKRVTGVEPEWVEPTPVVTKHGVYKGGYYPIKYDPLRSSKAEADVASEVQRQMERGLYVRAQTRRGHLEERVKSTGRPMRYDFGSVISTHVDQVIHDLAWHEWLIDANRLLRASAIDGAIRDHYGPEKLRAMKDMLRDIAVGDIGAQTAGDRVLNYLRKGATISGLGWRLTTSLMQPLGLTQSMVRIGPKWVLKGAMHWFGDAVTFSGAMSKITEKSDFMRLRAKTMQREINEIRNTVSGHDSRLEASYFYLIQKLQLVADVPTWWGSYEKAMHQNGMNESKAIALADQAVIDAQGSGQIKDLSGVQRGSPAWKLFTNFYSFFNTTYNLTRESVGRTNFKSVPSVALLAVDMALLYSIPALLGTLMKAALKGDWDDEDKFVRRLIADQLNYLFGTVVVVREFGSAIQAAMGQGGADYQGPASVRFFVAVAKLAKQIEQGEADAGFWKALNETAGTAFHYPAGQINSTADGIAALYNGETKNPGVLATGAPKP